MKAMILAAGFGTRLWPLTIGRTKPAIPFLNRPLIGFTIDYLRRYGFEDIIINLHHEPDSVRQQIGDGSRFGVRIHYSVEEPEILGTSGALDNVRNQLNQETFVVINGKIITDIDLAAALETHRQKHALATLVLKPNPRRERFSEVKITDDGRIAEFAGFPTPNSQLLTPDSPLMFTGIHLMEPEIFEYIPRGVFSDSVRDVYPRAMADGKTIAAHIARAESSWYELSTIQRYLEISLEFLAREGRDVVMDEACQIDPSAEVSNSILWKCVRIEAGARLTNCVIGDNVTIPAGAKIDHAVIVRADAAEGNERPEKALPAEVIGQNLVVKFG
ncbi:MAG: NDP-sugar synthase [Acidobacteria bacterium]|nr:NDP-sugar synthase [Acidobacteriota bacterium]